MKKTLFVVSCFAVTLAVAPACATKKFVRTEVGQVNEKVTTLGKSLEETQERVRVAEGRHRPRVVARFALSHLGQKAREARTIGAA